MAICGGIVKRVRATSLRMVDGTDWKNPLPWLKAKSILKSGNADNSQVGRF
jgi:hypothetical protein